MCRYVCSMKKDMTRLNSITKSWNAALWLIQILLSVIFIWAGTMKLFKPSELPFSWVKDNLLLVKLTGGLDIMAGVGLIMPSLLRIQPQLTVYVAIGVFLLMMTACVFHLSRGEGSDIGFNLFVAFLALFIVWGRLKKAPVQTK